MKGDHLGTLPASVRFVSCIRLFGGAAAVARSCIVTLAGNTAARLDDLIDDDRGERLVVSLTEKRVHVHLRLYHACVPKFDAAILLDDAIRPAPKHPDNLDGALEPRTLTHDAVELHDDGSEPHSSDVSTQSVHVCGR